MGRNTLAVPSGNRILNCTGDFTCVSEKEEQAPESHSLQLWKSNRKSEHFET